MALLTRPELLIADELYYRAGRHGTGTGLVNYKRTARRRAEHEPAVYYAQPEHRERLLTRWP